MIVLIQCRIRIIVVCVVDKFSLFTTRLSFVVTVYNNITFKGPGTILGYFRENPPGIQHPGVIYY